MLHLQALNYILSNGDALEQMLLNENSIEGIHEDIRDSAIEREIASGDERIDSGAPRGNDRAITLCK